MKLAIRQAKRGLGRTSPNPAVGAIIVRDGKVVGQGYHKCAGGPHAEVNALRSVDGLTDGCTLYVTLEPCNHQGRTPPCTKAIIESGISRVVVGMPDPNPSVSGGGNSFLTEKGIDVQCGVLEEECRSLNRPFIKHTTQGLPWVILKAGMSLDGKIAVKNGQNAWITSQKSREFVHKIRHTVDAILVGVNTAINDDPSLTTRLSKGRGRDPLRVIIDTNLRISPQAKMLAQQSDAGTIIYCGPDPDEKKYQQLIAAGAHIQKVALDSSGQLSLPAVLKDLAARNITSLLVEGGGKIHGSFVRQKLADQVNLFIAPLFMGADAIPIIDELGLNSVRDACRLHDLQMKKIDDDLMVQGLF